MGKKVQTYINNMLTNLNKGKLEKQNSRCERRTSSRSSSSSRGERAGGTAAEEEEAAKEEDEDLKKKEKKVQRDTLYARRAQR